jgi:pimeloyl-ACP methyl ester carboxylesterase
LDWGGTGETLVLLAGLGDNAHVYDGFAYQFIDSFHVIGITRRGFGRSSQPEQGYDLATRAREDIAVLDKLNIRQAVFVGHSVAGTEMNKLGAVYPARVRTLVYLDGLDIGYMMDRCIDADYFVTNDGTNIMAANNYHFLNNNIHHCGQEGIHGSDDSGPDGRIQGNEIHHIQAPPWIERS